MVLLLPLFLSVTGVLRVSHLDARGGHVRLRYDRENVASAIVCVRGLTEGASVEIGVTGALGESRGRLKSGAKKLREARGRNNMRWI